MLELVSNLPGEKTAMTVARKAELAGRIPTMIGVGLISAAAMFLAYAGFSFCRVGLRRLWEPCRFPRPLSKWPEEIPEP